MSPVLLGAIRRCEDDGGVRLVRVSDPRLRPVQHPLVAVEPGGRSCGACVAESTAGHIHRVSCHRASATRPAAILQILAVRMTTVTIYT